MLTKEDLALFKSQSKIIQVKKNDFFVKEDEICNYIGIVQSGTLYGYFEDADANFIVSELYGEQSLLTSYRSFLTDVPSPVFIKAYANAEIAVIDKTQYVELVKQQPWAYIFKKISDQLFINKCFKETALIKLKAKDRYLELVQTRKQIEQDFPQHLIASYLKIRPETLSRIKSLDLYQDRK
ncbi:Crp/Fnr family transcriptional regulator [Sphingobacterium detergens]|uniref:CRP-like cAMP-binding protein n=1 Tax=Sphingobacterium detergens TaxID=1145106 RepID=A0A420ARA3_SPHD1|nr:Crp/Fnr family transcriptional regulator [Sphingobacterium detergens]RKE47001.1 CRP-like cAMP-binding protein [Sphingobacterium detergens]